MKILQKKMLVRYLTYLAVVIALIAPYLSGNLYFLNLLSLMLVFIIFASSWNLLVFSGQGSLGHAAFFGISGYLSTLLALKMGISPYITLFLGAAMTAFIGTLVGLTCVRLKELFLAIVTFGFAIISQTAAVSFLSPYTRGWDGLTSPQLLSRDIAGYALYEYYSILVIAVACILVIHLILRSRIGLAFAAIRENEIEARAAGVGLVKYRLLAFTISAFFAGIAGALEVHHIGYITPEIFGIDVSFWPILYSIFGGLGTISGPIIGTVVLSILWNGLELFGLTYQRFIIIGTVLILLVIFLPRGLVSLPEEIGKRWRRRETRRIPREPDE